MPEKKKIIGDEKLTSSISTEYGPCCVGNNSLVTRFSNSSANN